ncbi:unannotated protein [freshwater metagenome]|uniref:Unannotated protein n=1 Tax=freshwater metagenome TaxID=449393 RepID=A0A6J7I938_9ZZZZ|nr:ATP-binding cassette domain-containing protein [Actinomycetota bacterium]
MSPVLRLEHFSYTYPGAVTPALKDVTLSVEPGEFVVVAGLSACGKSTLLRAASGLVPHFHGGTASGTAVTGGLDVRDHGPGDLAAVCGTLLQDPETQIVMGTVRSELAFPLENRGAAPAAVARGVEEAALALGVAGLLDRPTHELSGGELQRVALGAALAGRPQLVVLDEPTSQLDPVAGDELIWLLRRLNEEQGTAVLLAEHRLERCLAHADRVIVLEDGRVACDAPPSEMLAWAADRIPALQTPAARLFARAGLRPAPAGVKDARATLRAHGLLREGPAATNQAQGAPARRRSLRRTRATGAPAAVRAHGLWHEVPDGRSVLRGIDLELQPGELVALMGRNGSGKSTLLRHLAAMQKPTRGSVEAQGRVALLLQSPGDYFLHERVGDEASAVALAGFGLAELVDRHPRDLSGGERQRLALAIVLGDGPPPAALLLDEPTRGMDRAAKGDLIERMRTLGQAGTGVLVATHDAEFAAALADRVVLLADGRVIADASAHEVLAGGWHFATETARVLAGEDPPVLRPEEGGDLLIDRMTFEVTP